MAYKLKKAKERKVPSYAISLSKEEARARLKKAYGKDISHIRFGEIRGDGTRNVKFKLKGENVSFSYLTDIQ